MAYTHSDLEGVLTLLSSGKVRDLYEVDASTLLFVATDRISAYDVIMENGIPNKGILLTLLSAHWFTILRTTLPHLSTHFLSLSLPPALPPRLRNRSMLVRRLAIFPLEVIVRGYLSGSAWTEYQQHGTVHGARLPPGLRESEQLPHGPLYTPSTKAAPGEHDQNISVAAAAALIGAHHALRIEVLALSIYAAARAYAWDRGLILADTKFEFGLDDTGSEIVLADEVLTPDSSRFWPRDTYQVGRPQQSFDKQFLRDWLVGHGCAGKKGVTVPEEVVARTAKNYESVFEILTGSTLAEAVGQGQGDGEGHEGG